MMKIGELDHPSFQQMSFLWTRKLVSAENGDRITAIKKQRSSIGSLSTQESAVRVGMESPGEARWFERLRAELGF
jgi:hypothetical protein